MSDFVFVDDEEDVEPFKLSYLNGAVLTYETLYGETKRVEF